MAAVERTSDDSIASLCFENSDFGYKKVTIERPKRLKAQFSEERIAELRFDRTLRLPMEWAYNTFGNEVYTHLETHRKAIQDWADSNDLNLNTKQTNQLLSSDTWQRLLNLYNTAAKLMKLIGTDEYNDFNLFAEKVNTVLKAENIKLSATEKGAILSAVSWYDADAERVIKSKVKLPGDKLVELLNHLGCTEAQLPNYGYFPSGKHSEYIQYETESDLRDYENVPLKHDIYEYFLREVKPYISEAWINLDATKIGYEISFNKYFYRHKPLRSMEEVAADILKLDGESEGLIREILEME